MAVIVNGREQQASAGNPVVTRADVRTAFGDTAVAQLTPIVQIQFPYNLNADILDARDNGGTASVANSLLSCSTGAGANQSSRVLSRTTVKYDPGEGGLYRGTGVFTAGRANSTQYLGIGSAFDGYFFGYSGATFGVLRRAGGRAETRTITVTTKSSTAENITITLDGDALTTVAVTDATATDVTTTANEIAAADYSGVGDGWTAEVIGDTVIFSSWSAGTGKTGTYSLSSASTAVGSFAQTVAGVAVTETFIAQSSWNHDVMDGTGGSGMTLVQTNGNVYQIKYQWLGFGHIAFFIEDEASGEWVLVHRIHYANTATVPSIQNPTLPICWSVSNASNTTDMVLQSSSAAGFVEGTDADLGLVRGADGLNVDVATTELPIVSIHNKVIYQSVENRVNMRITFVYASSEATKVITLRFYLNATLTSAAWTDVSANTSVALKDTSATAITGGAFLFSAKLSKSDSQLFNLNEMKYLIPPGSHLTVTAQAESGTGHDVAVAINWKELF